MRRTFASLPGLFIYLFFYKSTYNKVIVSYEQDARNLFHERHLGVSSDGSTDATSANSILCRFIGIRIDTLFCWRNAEQPRLG